MKFYPLIFNLIFIFFLTICGESLYAQVEFIENKGQWDSRVKFMSNAGDGSFFLTENGFTISQYKSKDLQNIKDRIHGIDKGDFKSGSSSKNDIVKSHAYSVSFINGSTAAITGEKPLHLLPWNLKLIMLRILNLQYKKKTRLLRFPT